MPLRISRLVQILYLLSLLGSVGCTGTLTGELAGCPAAGCREAPLEDAGAASDAGTTSDAGAALDASEPNCGAFPTGCTLTCPQQDVIDLAMSRPLLRFDRSLAGGGHTWWWHGGEMGLALTAACGDPQADVRYLEQLRHLLTPGNGTTSPGSFPDQLQIGALVSLSLASSIPRIWEQLTIDERAKAELMLEAALVANAWLTSDANPDILAGDGQTAIDGDTNVHRDWNPNYRNGNLGSVIVAVAHFGSERAEEMLSGYDQSDFEHRLKIAGLANLLQTHTLSATPSDAAIESTLRQPYRYKGIPLEDVVGLYLHLTRATFAAEVTCSVGGGRIAQNCDALPNQGAKGMLTEFASSDANGARSSALYANDGLRPNSYLHVLLVARGLWENSDAAREVLSLIQVGVDDFFFKIDPALGGGYHGWAKGRSQGLYVLDDEHGHRITRELSRILGDHHDLTMGL